MGIFTDPDSSMKDQLEELRGKVERWANLIMNAYLHSIVVWKTLWGKIWSSIVYPIPLMTLIEDQRVFLKK